LQCPNCQFKNREKAVFCRKCGASLKNDIACPQCEFLNPADSRFCEKCGQGLKPPKDELSIDYSQPHSYTPKFLADKILKTRSSLEGERKLVTVLFADVANYTAMAEKLDPEQVHQIMDGCFKILLDEIHRYEGTINQFTGDGVMALFGAPVAHEDHAQQACHAALSIQKALTHYGDDLNRRLGIHFKMRMGLNSGEVVVGAIGDDLRMDYTAVGDTTNLAARMESHAEPGSILVTSATYKLARDYFVFDALGAVAVKGKVTPQQVYELVETGDVDTRIRASVAKGLTQFVGRKNSMAALNEFYERARSGAGQVVGVVGEAGVGKSRLLLEFVNRLPENETFYLEGRCLHYGAGMAYLPVLDMLRAYFGIQPEDRELAVKKALDEIIRNMDRQLLCHLPAFQEILSVTVDDEKYLQLDPGSKKMRTFEAIRDLFIRISEHRPLVLAVEDLHWIDKTSEACIDYLIDWLADTRILLILLYRLEYTHPWGSKSHYGKIGLTQLGFQSSSELVQAILEGGQTAPALRDLVLERSGGNPLFVEELTHSLLENGTIQKKDDRYVLTRDPSHIRVPDTIHGIIAARMDRIEESLKRVMQVASVIGRVFAFRILQTMTEVREDLKSHLLNLQGLEFISKKSLFPELEYIFKHALTQEVAYNSLLQQRRREIHERVGLSIEAQYPDRLEEYYELLAYHYGQSDNKQKAMDYLDLANGKAIRLNAMQEAMDHFTSAMAVLDGLADTRENRKRRIILLLGNWIVFWLLYRTPDYAALLSDNEGLVKDLGMAELLGPFYGRLGQIEWVYGNFEKAIQLSNEAAKLCESEKKFTDAGIAYMLQQWCHFYKGDFEKTLYLKNEVFRMMKHRFDLRTNIWAMTGASWAYTNKGCWQKALHDGYKALKISEEYSDNSLISFALWIIAVAYLQQGDMGKAVKFAELGVQKAPTPADRQWAQMTLAWCLCRAGKPETGVNALMDMLPLVRKSGFRVVEVTIMNQIAEGHLLARQKNRAAEAAASGLNMAFELGMKFNICWAYRLFGEIALQNRPDESAEHFEKTIDIAKEIRAENELALAYAGYGRYYRQMGDIVQAKDYLNQSLEIFERLGTLIEPDKVRKELAQLSEA
jgi:class 3 adenylate cyclase/tetratricopeptide (TPR) repeat protein